MRKFISYEDYLLRRGQNASFDAPQTVNPSTAIENCSVSAPNGDLCETPVCAPAPPEHSPRVITERPVRRKTGWVSVVFLLICFGVAIAAAILMANGLNLSHLRGNTATVTLNAYRAYCVQMSASATSEDAAKIAADVRKKGGGGYVFVTDGLYMVLASAYESEADCNSVITKLSQSKTNASKFIVEIPSVSLSIKPNSALRESIEKGYAQLWQVFPELYTVSVTLDESSGKYDAARLAIGKIKERVRLRIDAFSDKEDSTLVSVHIKAALTALESQLDALYIDTDHDSTLSHDIKYTYLKVLYDLKALQKELA